MMFTKNQLRDIHFLNKQLIIIGDNVYNISNWIDKHPGGKKLLEHCIGRDVTNEFNIFHPKYVEKYLSSMYYGKSNNNDDNDLLILKETMEKEGLFKNDIFYWIKKLLSLGLLLFFIVWGSYSDSQFIHIICAIGLGIFFQQMAFIGHDAGHNGITGNKHIDSIIGLFVGNMLTGVGISWWKHNHNVHHVVTNSIENDPDIQHVPFLAVNSEYLKSDIYSTFYNKFLGGNRMISRLLCSYQHKLYYIIMCVARINLYIQSLIHIINNKVDNAYVELFSLFIFYTWLSFLVYKFPNPILFLGISHATAGILHVQITLSHYPMKTYRGIENFITSQLDGTMNIESSEYMDWFHGGLQFQIEHHLFPRLPRHNLRKAKKFVMEFCKLHKLSYKSVSFIEANRLLLKNLERVAIESRGLSTIIINGMNMIG